MSNLIEQAARRLEQLRQAGVEVPEARPRESLASRDIEQAMASSRSLRNVSAEDARVSPQSESRRQRDGRQPAIAREVESPATLGRRIELNLQALSAAGMITPNSPRSITADQYRVVKRPLIRNATGRGTVILNHGNLIMVTSALAGEGKSFTSINLAMSIAAELDHTVMLVDADVARPSVLRMLGAEQAARGSDGKVHGLLDVLEGRAELSDVMLRTNVDKLTILPAGGFHERATELLASDSMRQLLDGMARRYPDRIVIFDSPPLLLTTEARVLATHMGQIVVVVHAERTAQSAVANALATIESCPVRMLLLNQARESSEAAYGYGYGYGASERDDDTPRADDSAHGGADDQ
jgi:exopolysaccharide/PEP-CTERM locus tyrosine autokinase